MAIDILVIVILAIAIIVIAITSVDIVAIDIMAITVLAIANMAKHIIFGGLLTIIVLVLANFLICVLELIHIHFQI